MDNNTSLLKMEGISKKFPGVIALHNAQFTLEAGEIHALLGENGAGKSTLIKVLTGVEKRDRGTIMLNGNTISPTCTKDAQDIGISTVYQEVNLCPNLSVAENIFIGREFMKHGRIDWKLMNSNAKNLLKKFNLDIDVSKKLNTYSVSIQQLVAIARASDISAKVLILDEPTSSLTQVEVDKLFSIMRMLKNQGVGIIFVTHFLDQVYTISDKITVLRNGEYVGTYNTKELPKVELVGKMIGKEYEQISEISAHTANDNETKELLVSIKGATSVNINNGINLDINKGEVLGLSGLLGSGRSETIRMIFGNDHLKTGSIAIKGKTIHIKNSLTAIRNGFAYCPENRKTEGIVGDLSIRENIILALQAKRGLFKAIKKSEATRIADAYIKKLSIKTPSQNQLIKNLSGGNQQKVILARWLATHPDLLMLDEPTRGIDIGAKAEIQKIVVKLADQGMSLIFVSSEIDEMLRCCNRISVLSDKKIVAELRGDEISEHGIMKHIAGGIAHEQN